MIRSVFGKQRGFKGEFFFESHLEIERVSKKLDGTFDGPEAVTAAHAGKLPNLGGQIKHWNSVQRVTASGAIHV